MCQVITLQGGSQHLNLYWTEGVRHHTDGYFLGHWEAWLAASTTTQTLQTHIHLGNLECISFYYFIHSSIITAPANFSIGFPDQTDRGIPQRLGFHQRKQL